MPRKKNSNINIEARKKARREYERKRRAKIKADPVKYEEAKEKERARRQRRKEQRKILSIQDLSRRDQKAQREKWRERTRKSRALKKCRERGLQLIRDNTPSSEVDINEELPQDPIVSSPIRQGDTTPRDDSPMVSPFRPLSRGETPSSTSSRDSVMSRQRRQALKEHKQRRKLTNVIIMKQKAKIKAQQMTIHNLQVKMNRLIKKVSEIPIQARKRQRCIKDLWHQRKISVQRFLESEENSMISPGVKDTITRQKIKKQKRYLTDSMENLHKKYNAASDPRLKISYASFCRLRPFWIVKAKLTSRDTCLCVLHDNYDMMLNRLKSLKIIQNGDTVIEGMMPRKKNSNINIEARKKARREYERKRRAKIKADPVKYEEAKEKERARRQRRKEQRKILSIQDLSRRDQKAQREKWRERTRKSRALKKCRERGLQLIRDNTPSSEVDINEELPQDPIVSSPIRQGDTTPRDDSPMVSPFRPLSRGETPSSTSSRDSVMSRQRRQALKEHKQRRKLTNVIIMKQKAKIKAQQMTIHNLQVKMNRLIKKVSEIPIQARKRQRCIKDLWHQRKISVQRFLESEENSMISPGVKDTITRQKIKKQKRYLTDSMENLHKKYNAASDPRLKISYASFCRLRPFWIVKAKLTSRDTCLCVLHDNYDMMLNRLKSLKIIQNGDTVIEGMVCNPNSFQCMSRKCSQCLHKTPNFMTFENESIFYNQWVTENEEREIKGRIKSIRRTIKCRLTTDKKGLVEAFLEILPRFLLHIFNIRSQYQAINHIKTSLRAGEIMLRIDFSENYACKYFSEIQSIHFGASRQQISIHTGVLYYLSDVSGEVDTMPFCSVSVCLRHDAAAVYAHLKIALTRLITNQNIKVLHIVSDGPSSQYKNKNNFYLFTQHLVRLLNISAATWNFTETAHGKGPADGVGAALKGAANNYVLKGNDIPDYQTFVQVVKTNCNVLVYEVSEQDIKDAEYLLSNSVKILNIPGTKNMHQLTWSTEEPTMLNIRELSCADCEIKDTCLHYPCSRRPIVRLTSARDRLSSANNSDPIQPEFGNNSAEVDKHNLKEGTWVLAKFSGKKNLVSLFVGQIVSLNNDDPDAPYYIKFTKKKYHNVMSGDAIFTWNHNDYADLGAEDIVCVLQEPTPGRRGELIFKFDSSLYRQPIM
uniref:Uncharacterized protein n=1 Tax=Heliothis virescens TaxID=7102 RepID=A0A2A4ISZ8_HELVI